MSLFSNCLFVRQALSRTGLVSSSKFLRTSRFSNGFRYKDQNERFLSTNASAAQPENPSATPPVTEQKVEIDVKQLVEQNAKLTEEANEFKDRYKRALAETENTRVRFNKMVADAKIFGIQSFCKDLLEVSDILNLALTNTPKEISSDVKILAKDFTNLHQGLTMTEERMQKIFTKNGLLQIKPSEGDKFDPNFHEALFQAKIPTKTSGTIIQVMKIGYRLQDRVIRAAQVGVAQ